MFPLNPPLLNSSNLWATSKEDLEALYLCPSTGAITTRTSLLGGFLHDDNIHMHCFIDMDTLEDLDPVYDSDGEPDECYGKASSLNTLGYSPVPLAEYMSIVRQIQGDHQYIRKPVIFSVTGTPDEIAEAYRLLSTAMLSTGVWAMEINLSCPNIPDKPPPAYDSAMLASYLQALLAASSSITQSKRVLNVGLKLPPYTYAGQFSALINALEISDPCPISFLTSTNTLGSTLIFTNLTSSSFAPRLTGSSGEGIGGLGGAAIHPLALGNVATLRRMLDEKPRLRAIRIIGVGGVSDNRGYERMKAAGADAVGVGTALGFYGVGVFKRISGAEARA